MKENKMNYEQTSREKYSFSEMEDIADEIYRTESVTVFGNEYSVLYLLKIHDKPKYKMIVESFQEYETAYRCLECGSLYHTEDEAEHCSCRKSWKEDVKKIYPFYKI